jgi:hypothetical protein
VSAIVVFTQEIAAELQCLSGALVYTIVPSAEVIRAAIPGTESPPITMSDIFEKKANE